MMYEDQLPVVALEVLITALLQSIPNSSYESTLNNLRHYPDSVDVWECHSAPGADGMLFLCDVFVIERSGTPAVILAGSTGLLGYSARRRTRTLYITTLPVAGVEQLDH